MKSPADIVAGIILLILAGIGAWSVNQLPPAGATENVGPGGIPKITLILLVFFSILLIIKGICQAPKQSYWPEKKVFKKIIIFMLLFFIYLLGLVGLDEIFAHMETPIFEWGGAFGISTFIFLLIALPLLGRRKPLEVFLVAFLTTAIQLVVFGHFFQVMLP